MPTIKNGQLYVVGLGPGDQSLMTAQALMALERSSCIAGYGPYLDLLPGALKRAKKLISSGMRQEKERCQEAIRFALAGEVTSMVCSGDPGIYAMASLVIEILKQRDLLNSLSLEIVPGIPALCAAAARLGAPLGHDFACISLSDLLTPWEVIKKRLMCAFEGDFVTVLYNPRSKGRPDYLAFALSLAKKWRKAECPVAMARNVFRQGEELFLSSLENFAPEDADMLSIVIIGNNQSVWAGKYMLTPRGYFSSKFR